MVWWFWSSRYGPIFLVTHWCITSMYQFVYRLPSKAKYEKTPLLGLTPNLTYVYCCRFTYTSICRQFSQFVTLCKELQKIRIIYIIIMICKVYNFKSYNRHKTKQTLTIDDRNIEKQLIILYYSTSRTETSANRNFGENSWKFLSRILLLVTDESLCSRNTWVSHLQKFHLQNCKQKSFAKKLKSWFTG